MSNKPALSIGMATHTDFHGVFFTVQSLRLHQDISDCELIVVDNNPDSPDGEAVRGFLQNISGFELPIKYIPFVESQGTTQTRERIFTESSGDAVLVMDCHVLLQANALHRLKKFYAEADETARKNLYTGPLLMDGLNFVMTHFEPEWRDQMWGTWAAAWQHPDGTFVVCRSSNQNDPASGTVETKKLNTDGPWRLTQIPWVNHEKHLMDRGYKVYGFDSDAKPMEIPAQGLGLFSSVREHWLGFNPNFRSFGGEECYIHEKYRQAGRTTYCLPFLKWNHRFGRPGGPKYPLTVEGKIRNYLIGFDELGLDREPIRKHFVDEVKVSQERFDMIAADPVAFTPYVAPPKPEQPQKVDAVATSNLGHPLPPVARGLGDVVEFLIKNPRDLDQHVNAFMKWTLGCNSAAEITKRRESTAFLLAGLGRKLCGKANCNKETCAKTGCKETAELYSWQEEGDTLLGLLQELVTSHEGRPLSYTVTQANLTEMIPEIPKVDLLFLDTRHTGERLLAELQTYSPNVAKRIMVHDTALYGLVGEGDSKGLWWAIRSFTDANPDWFVAEHTDAQYGMTVLSRIPEDRPEALLKPWPKSDAEGNACGCGTNLKAWLKKIGIEATEGCSCNARAKIMDAQGPQWCKDNIETILDWLYEEANKRNMGGLFFRPAVKLIVQRAISKAEKDEKAGLCG